MSPSASQFKPSTRSYKFLTRDKAPSPPVLFEKTIATVSQVEGIGVNEWCNLLNVLVLVCRI
jgi:hypothetical protein